MAIRGPVIFSYTHNQREKRHPEGFETTCRDNLYRNERIEVGCSRCGLNRLSEIRLDSVSVRNLSAGDRV